MLKNLDEILDGMIELEADAVTLEWDRDGLEVTMHWGSKGVGGVLSPTIGADVMEEVVNRAKLKRRSKGVLKATIRGRQMRFAVREYDYFLETAFEIRAVR